MMQTRASVIRQLKLCNLVTRSLSSTVSVEQRGNGMAIMTLNNPPVNVLTLGTMKSIVSEMKSLEDNKDCLGVVIRSSSNRAFSAGLDMNELAANDRPRLRIFWSALLDMWFQIYNSRLATVAAVNGSAIAGGCVVAIMCDRRIMLSGPKHYIGLNETKIGIVLPFWCSYRLAELIGQRNAEDAIIKGTLFKAEEALRLGIVDAVVSSPEDLAKTAEQELKQLIAIPDHARRLSKAVFREPLVSKFLREREASLDASVDSLLSNETQSVFRKYLDSIKKN